MGLPHIIIGAGGHARVLIKTLQHLDAEILGVTDARPDDVGPYVAGVPVLGADDILEGHDPSAVLLVNGIGSVGDMTLRRAVFEGLQQRGFRFATVMHPAAFCEDDVELGEGAQVMAAAVLQTGCRIGANTIVNTSASIDHDCIIGAHCHIAPGAVLSGDVRVGDAVHIGAGAVVIQGIEIGAGCQIAAGSVVTKSLEPGEKVAGVPARARAVSPVGATGDRR